ncbi:hypothetical protein G3N94_10670 [Burkholderia sp. Ac-20353]|nr:hypothetical protein [Burkholderia sp. Ac-20353]
MAIVHRSGYNVELEPIVKDDFAMAGCGNPDCKTCRALTVPTRNDEDSTASLFDEQLWLLGKNNEPGAHLPYSVLLGDGGYLSTDRIYIDSQDRSIATTHGSDVGSSRVKVPLPEGKERGLTAEEIAAARTVFADGVDYGKVKVHHGGWWLFMGQQDSTTAVTPNGEMYFPSAIYRDNFATADDGGRALFMHEMVHVWQYQMGYAVKRNALTVTSRGKTAYAYTLTPTSRLSEFNMEQQGDIMSDYYMICILERPQPAHNRAMSPELLHKVMTPFVNPRDKNHLPR